MHTRLLITALVVAAATSVAAVTPRWPLVQGDEVLTSEIQLSPTDGKGNSLIPAGYEHDIKHSLTIDLDGISPRETAFITTKGLSGLRLVIIRDYKVVVNSILDDFNWPGHSQEAEPSLESCDLDGDGIPELLVRVMSMGAQPGPHALYVFGSRSGKIINLIPQPTGLGRGRRAGACPNA